MDYLIKLWNQLSGKSIDDKTLLKQEQERVEKLKEATKVQKEKQEIHSQLTAVRKEAKELEAGLGKHSRIILYAAGIGLLLIIVIIAKSCIGG